MGEAYPLPDQRAVTTPCCQYIQLTRKNIGEVIVCDMCGAGCYEMYKINENRTDKNSPAVFYKVLPLEKGAQLEIDKSVQDAIDWERAYDRVLRPHRPSEDLEPLFITPSQADSLREKIIECNCLDTLRNRKVITSYGKSDGVWKYSDKRYNRQVSKEELDKEKRICKICGGPDT